MNLHRRGGFGQSKLHIQRNGNRSPHRNILGVILKTSSTNGEVVVVRRQSEDVEYSRRVRLYFSVKASDFVMNLNRGPGDNRSRRILYGTRDTAGRPHALRKYRENAQQSEREY